MSQRSIYTTLYNFAVFCTLFSPQALTSNSKPSAVSVPIRSDWRGNDGFWSPVSVRVGTPPQWLELFPSTASQETWVVGPGGCDGTQQCFTERGGVFTLNQSSSWTPLGAYELGLDPQLGFEGKGVYGIDKIALSDTVSVPSQMVGIINSTDYWLGFFGLGVKPTNFTNADQKTFLDAMVENQSLVPSHSYGYTAGAHYRLKGVPGSLTLGGYDASRFVPQDQSFELDPDQNPVVAVNQITVTADPLPSSNVSTGWQGGSTDLLDHSQADLFTIDSSTPFLWLPKAVCSQFEKALNLTYDDGLELYKFADNVAHQTLVNWNLSFAFTIADLPGSSKTVSLSLPYSAFDLQLSYPYPGLNITQYDPAVSYFPLRKAANTTQYTIGRSFLQETYLMVDYERNNFSIHPATFSIDPLQNMALVDISRPSNSTWSGPKTGKAPSLSTGATVGIAIAAIVGFAFLICLLVVVRKIRRDHPDDGYIRETNGSEKSQRMSKSKSLKRFFGFAPQTHRTNTSGADRSAVQAPGQLDAVEIGGDNLAFSPGLTSPGTELDSNDTEIRGFYEKDNRDPKGPHIVVNAIGHDPSRPVELPYRASNYRSSTREEVPQEGIPGNIHFSRPGLPTFAMVHKQPPTRQGTQKSMAVSSPSDGGHSSREDSDPTHLVSPITPTREESPAFSSLDSIARRAAWFLSKESPSVSSESRGATERSPPGTMTIEERAGFPKNHSRHDTVSSMGQKSSTGAPSVLDTISPQESSASHTRVPRNSRATGLGRMESQMTWQSSNRSTVTNDIRHSVHRGFSWVPATHEPDVPPLAPRTPVTAGTEQSPYSPARWIEFWKTGRDPRLGPASDRKPST